MCHRKCSSVNNIQPIWSPLGISIYVKTTNGLQLTPKLHVLLAIKKVSGSLYSTMAASKADRWGWQVILVFRIILTPTSFCTNPTYFSALVSMCSLAYREAFQQEVNLKGVVGLLRPSRRVTVAQTSVFTLDFISHISQNTEDSSGGGNSLSDYMLRVGRQDLL